MGSPAKKETTPTSQRLLRLFRIPPTMRPPPYEAPMPFSIRPHRRFPVFCPITYHAGLHEGHDGRCGVRHEYCGKKKVSGTIV